jgi:hypothetical protein
MTKKTIKTNKTSVVATLKPQIITQSVGVTDVTNKCKSIGDSLDATFHNTGDFKAAQGAIHAYGTAVSAMKALLIYKKLTGTPIEIEFFKN